MNFKLLHKNHFLLIAIAILFLNINAFAQQKKVLVFNKTTGFRHTGAIEAGRKALPQLGSENNFAVDITEDATKFTSENLKQYAAVIFFCTTGDVLDAEQQKAFEKYIQSGGGFVGTHSAADTEYDWPWYGELVGAYFMSHPSQQEAVLNVIDRNNIATRHLPAQWKKMDEWYDFKWIYSDLNILITIDENSYGIGKKGGQNGEFHPMAWYHDYDGGRAFYTEFGHDKKYVEDPLFLQHLLGGIKYAMGAKPQDQLSVSVK